MKKTTLNIILPVLLFLCNTVLFAQGISFTANTNPGCAPASVTFTNTSSNGLAYKFVWSFGDGSPNLVDTLPTTVTHIYSSGGFYNPFLTVYDINNNNLGFSYGNGNIMVSGASIGSPDSACVNDMVNFCVNGNNVNSASWNFGDPSSGANNTSNQMCENHSFTSNGTYTITLTSNSSCGTTTITKTIVVGNAYPHPNAWANPNPACPGQVINFNTGGYSTYSWNFADPASGANNTSSLQYPTHTYSSLGVFTATLTVTNGCGHTGTTTDVVTIVANPAFPTYPDFKLDVNSPSCPNSNVSLNAPGGYSNYEWNFNDGSALVTTTSNYSNHIFSTLGNYNVSVKITSPCGNDTTLTKLLQITNSAPFLNSNQNFQLNTSSPSCPNSSVGFEAPYGYVSYVWNYGDGSPLVTSTNYYSNHLYGSAITTYTATVKITNGCGNDTTISNTVQIMNNVGFPNQSWFSVNAGPNPACANDPIGFNAPSGYSSYAWTFGDGTTAFSTQNNVSHGYATLGTKNISVKITNACGRDTTITTSVVINSSGSFPNYLQIETPGNASCPNDLIQFRVNQSGFQSYSWNFGDGNTATSTAEKIEHSFTTVGTYTVTCTITNGCGNTTIISAIVQISSTAPVDNEVTVNGVQNPSCINDEVFFIVDHGQTTYTYVWNFGDSSPLDTTIGTGAQHVYTALGIYTVTTTVINGCGSTKVITTTQVISTNAVPTLRDAEGKKTWGFPGGDDHGNGANNVAGCAGDAIIFYFMGAQPNNVWNFGDGNTGTATEHLVVYGGDGAFPVTIIKHAFAANGTYLISLTFTNSCGNSVTDTMSIKIGGNLAVNGELATSPPPFTTCTAVDFLAFGGSSYTYNFGDGTTPLVTSSPTVSHTFSAQGVYAVNVLVTNGCGNTATYSRTVNVNGVGGPAVSLTSSASPTCVSGNNGSATISVSSGQAPYIYSWDTQTTQTAATATGLSEGLYNATVTDATGCSTTLAVAISDPAPMILNVSKTTTTCGGATGTASVVVTSGGSGSYSYLWSTGSTSSSVTGLAAGAYSVTVTDDVKGCISISNVSISEAGGATVAINTTTGTTCNGSATGSIDINVTGGTAPYIYAWSNGSNSQDPTGLLAGSYSVTVTDNSGCRATLNATVSEPAIIVVTPSVVTAPTCGNFDGKATASVTGGTSPYTYLWDAGAANQNTQTAVGLPAGTYSVTVTDSKGCTMTNEISLSNSNAPSITAVVTDVSCFGGSNGAINISVSGGTSPYLYNWSVGPPQTNNQDVNTLTPGNYLVFVNDAKGCMSLRTYTIAQPAVLAASVTTSGASCGNVDGSATAVVTGGNVPYTYLWTGGQATQTATGLALGNYTVAVTDNKGCTASSSTTVNTVSFPVNICMVTVDDLSTHNIIIWEKPIVNSIDSFKVYREDVTNVYTHIGSVSYDSLSEFHDLVANPNVTTFRYKISALDNCGNESTLSPYHNTIRIIDNGAGQFTWNPLYTIENTTNPVNNYVLMRDDISTGVWLPIQTTAGTQYSITDPLYTSYPSASYYVSTDWGISCSPTRATVSTSRSNIKHSVLTTGIANNVELNSVMIYPNPASDVVTIELPALTQNATVTVMNSIGQIVYEQSVISSGNANKAQQINTGSFAKGVYTISIESKGGKVFKKLVIN